MMLSDLSDWLAAMKSPLRAAGKGLILSRSSLNYSIRVGSRTLALLQLSYKLHPEISHPEISISIGSTIGSMFLIGV